MQKSNYSYNSRKKRSEKKAEKMALKMDEKRIEKRDREKAKKKKLWKIIAFSVLGVFLAIALALGLYFYQAFNQPETLFNTSSVDQQTPKPMNEDIVGTTPGIPSALPAATPSSTPVSFADKHIVNILLLGLDLDYKTYAAHGGDYHTDSIIVLAVNFDKNTVDMISLPRDSFTHVPGIKGIYKLNAAINCGGGKTEAGFKKVCEAASWMLGGVNIDYYYAFELDTVKEIGNLIKGVDFDVDMNYTGSSGKSYKKGLQHLDGTGIYDYMRARHNATDDTGDVGRMARGKAMLKAIYKKLKDQNMLTKVPELVSTVDKGLYTNATLQQSIALANFAYSYINADSIQTHTMKGDIHYALGWKFYFIDQKARKKLISQVYGIDAPELQFISYGYAKWLESDGLNTIRYLATALQVSQYIQDKGTSALSSRQLDSYNAFIESYNKTQAAYDTAALSLRSADNKAMENAQDDLRHRTEDLAKSVGYTKELIWIVRKTTWFNDPCINEVKVDFN